MKQEKEESEEEDNENINKRRKWGFFNHALFGTAISHSETKYAKSKIDLRGTPFAVKDNIFKGTKNSLGQVKVLDNN